MSSATTLEQRIRRLYDDTTQGWVDVWGEHLHHGHYGPSGQARKDHLQAQVDMVDEVLDWAGVTEAARVLDAGCGVGGSARHIATRFSAEVEGVTLSPVQRDIAKRLSGERKDVHFQVADANATPFPDESFDVVWSLESAEHMPDKRAFVAECARVLKPGGRLVVATWCHRPVPPELSDSELSLLERVSWSYGRSLTWVPLSDYDALLPELGLGRGRSEDWSETVKPFWSAVLRSVLTVGGLRALMGGGRSMVVGAYGGLFMRRGLKTGTVRYVVLTAEKKGVEG